MSEDVKTLEQLTQDYKSGKDVYPVSMVDALSAGGYNYSVYKDFVDAFTETDNPPSDSTGLGRIARHLGALSAAADNRGIYHGLVTFRNVSPTEAIESMVFLKKERNIDTPVFDMFVRYCSEKFGYDVVSTVHSKYECENNG